MPRFDSLVIQDQRHLKWRALDPIEQGLMILCGICIAAFSVLVFCDVTPRASGRPGVWVLEATMTFFLYGIFIGVAAATRRNDHLYLAVLAESMSGNARLFFEAFNRLCVLGVAFAMIYYGYLNFLDGFKSLRMPSMMPMATFYAAIPISGFFVALFTIEQMVNGFKNGFANPDGVEEEKRQSL